MFDISESGDASLCSVQIHDAMRECAAFLVKCHKDFHHCVARFRCVKHYSQPRIANSYCVTAMPSCIFGNNISAMRCSVCTNAKILIVHENTNADTVLSRLAARPTDRRLIAG